MGSLCSSGEQMVERTELDPEVKTFRNNTLDIANRLTEQPYQTYGQPRIADFSGDTRGMFNQVRQGQGQFTNQMGGAMQTAASVGNRQPTFIGGTADSLARTQRGGNIGDRYTRGGDRAAPTTPGGGATANMATPGQGANMEMFKRLMQGGADPGMSDGLASFFGRLQQGGGISLPQGQQRSPAMSQTVLPQSQTMAHRMTQPQMNAYTSDIERAQAQTLDPASLERINAERAGASQFTDANMAAYMNQYQQAALNPALREIQRQAQLMQMGNATKASSSGAFGGSRHALLDAETQRNALQQLADTEAQGMAGAFDRSANIISQDQQRQLQAALANQATGLQAGMANQQFTNQARFRNQDAANQFGLANQAAANRANQFNAIQRQAASQRNAELGQQTNLANQQADLSQQGINLQGAQLQGNLARQGQTMRYEDLAALGDIGRQQQGMDQANMSLAYQDFMDQMNYPQQMLNLRASTLAGQPYDKTAYGQGPNNAASYAGLFASLLGGAGKFNLFGG